MDAGWAVLLVRTTTASTASGGGGGGGRGGQVGGHRAQEPTAAAPVPTPCLPDPASSTGVPTGDGALRGVQVGAAERGLRIRQLHGLGGGGEGCGALAAETG